MTAASEWRRRIGAYVGAAYAADDTVAAVLVGGSSARGHADRSSDVEVGVFWHRTPDEDTIAAIAARLDAELHQSYSEDGWHLQDYFVGSDASAAPRSGVLVEVVGLTVDDAQRALDRVVREHDPDPDAQLMVSGVANGIPIAGEDLLARWRADAAYPDALAAAVVRRWGPIDHWWRWRMWLERDNRTMLARQLADVAERVLHLHLAVNRTYFSGLKWIDHVARGFTHGSDLHERLRAVWDAPVAEAPPLLARLVEDTYDLVETRVAGLNVDALRHLFRWERPLWGDEPPPRNPLGPDV